MEKNNEIDSFVVLNLVNNHIKYADMVNNRYPVNCYREVAKTAFDYIQRQFEIPDWYEFGLLGFCGKLRNDFFNGKVVASYFDDGDLYAIEIYLRGALGSAYFQISKATNNGSVYHIKGRYGMSYVMIAEVEEAI